MLQEPGPLDQQKGYVVVDGNLPAQAVCDALSSARDCTMQVGTSLGELHAHARPQLCCLGGCCLGGSSLRRADSCSRAVSLASVQQLRAVQRSLYMMLVVAASVRKLSASRPCTAGV